MYNTIVQKHKFWHRLVNRRNSRKQEANGRFVAAILTAASKSAMVGSASWHDSWSDLHA